MAARRDDTEGEIRRLYRSVELAVRPATLTVGHDGRIVLAHKLGALLGTADEHLVGQPVVPEGWHLLDEDGRRVRDDEHPAARCATTGREVTAVVGLVAPGGRVTWLRCSAHPVVDDPAVAVDVSIEDHDRRARTREAVEASERRFRTLAELVPVAIYEASASGEITYVNAAFTRLTGYADPTDVPDLPMLQIVHPDDLHVVLEAAGRSPERGAYQARYRVVHLDGSARWVTSRMSLLVDDVGRVAGFVGAIEDVDDLQRAEQEARRQQDELSRLARHDSLTGLPNRSVLDERIAAARVRGGAALALFVDLDHFKAVNDVHGHAVGDEVLVEVAARLAEVVRDGDLVVRIGGDEFAGWCAVPSSPRAVAGVGQRLADAVAARPVETAVGPLRITASVGVATCRPGGVEDLLARADAALYRAKAAGRARAEVDLA